jgi:hypothetical protein
MTETTHPGQIWCWGATDDGVAGSRLWLITDVWMNFHDGEEVRDGLAVDLEDGEEKHVFNLPLVGGMDEFAFASSHPAWVVWRRFL